jgi:hypothetical protein
VPFWGLPASLRASYWNVGIGSSVIFDFRFWIFDWRSPAGHSPALAATGREPNRKPKIKNRK